jgi:hypothetical protein
MCTSDDQFLLPLPLTAQLEGMGIERSAIALKFDTQQMAAPVATTLRPQDAAFHERPQ